MLIEIKKSNDFKLLIDLLEVVRNKCESFEEFINSERCEVNTQGACAASCFFVAVHSVVTKKFSGRAVRDDLLLVAWQPFLFLWQNYKILFNSIIMLFSETGGLPFCF